MLQGCVAVVVSRVVMEASIIMPVCVCVCGCNNNNNNNHDNVHGAIIMTKVIAIVHPVHLMNVD